MISDLIIDVGMHKGEDTDFYLAKGFRVVAVEANPQLCSEMAARQAEAVADGRLTIVNAAVSDTAGPVTFYVDRVTDWSTAQTAWVARNARMGGKVKEITVDGVRFADILADFGVPYFLKIDIEGNDILCLEALHGANSRPKFISIESGKTDLSGLRREFDHFRQLGYDRFKVVNQLRVPDQKCPEPPREGRHVAHEFPFGASGLFGEEAPGPWLTRRQAWLFYRWIFTKYAAVGNDGVVPNLHKRFKRSSPLKKILHPGWYDTHARLA